MITPVPAPDTYGYTIFCDDIREEGNKKRIYIGVYNAVMNVRDSPPATLMKLALEVHYYEKPGEQDPIQLTVTLPGEVDPVFKMEVPAETRARVPIPGPEEGAEPADARISLVFGISLSP